MKTWTVGVFAPIRKGEKYLAYIRRYNPAWPGCCVHKVEAQNGIEAKIRAIAQHKKVCIDNN